MTGHFIVAAVAVAWLGLTAAAYQKWGYRGLLGIPIGVLLAIGYGVVALNVACWRAGACA